MVIRKGKDGLCIVPTTTTLWFKKLLFECVENEWLPDFLLIYYSMNWSDYIRNEHFT